MANKVRLAGLLVALGFVVYLGVYLLNLHTEAIGLDAETDISPASIVGSILAFVGVAMLSRELRFPKALRGTILGIIIASALLGRVATGMPSATPDDVRSAAIVGFAQSGLISIAIGLALGWRGSMPVRILAGVGLAGNVGALVLFLTGFESALATLDSEAFLLKLHFVAILDNLMLLAAVLFTLDPPGLPAGVRAVGSNPFAQPSAPAPMDAMPRPAPATVTMRPVAGGAQAAAAAQGSGTVQVAATRRLACPRCANVVTVTAGAKPSCGKCGYGA